MEGFRQRFSSSVPSIKFELSEATLVGHMRKYYVHSFGLDILQLFFLTPKLG